MKLHTIDTGFFKLDGGAMFGIVPKVIWNKLNEADENNLCNWAMRCLLIEDGDRLILIDNGIGQKQSEKFFGYYHLSGDASLHQSLKNLGFTPNDITDNLLSHLHFDHVGGAVQWNEDRTKYELTFSKAKYWSHSKHWLTATQPNAREKASFLKENILPIEESGHLHLIDQQDFNLPSLEWFTSSGHTDSMIVSKIKYKNHVVCFVADMFPSMHHIPVNYHMGYDINPLVIMDEKSKFLKEAAENNYILFFEHDPVNEACTIELTERGYKPKDIFKLSDLS
ncbi:MAG: MBL fold metallo-hydrolase [Bacteroidetes bacterium]|nr:MBL fold metallo-hydrolase [Bacteroidota bacterium]